MRSADDFRTVEPWYILRPTQLLHRVGTALRRTPTAPVVVRMPWGVHLEVDPRETIGRAIWTTGIYDLAVSEALFRLTRPGDLVIDAGANIGYMTTLFAVRAGVGGRVLAFEPHPVVVERLRGNVARLTARSGVATVDIHPTGLSAAAGEAGLVEAEGGEQNHGLARIGSGEGGVRIRTERLDDVVDDGKVGVLKMDVEVTRRRCSQGRPICSPARPSGTWCSRTIRGQQRGPAGC